MDPQRRSYLIEAASESQASSTESALAKAWLESHLAEYQDLDWQKRVGPGITLGPDYSPNQNKMAYQASRKRIDLVGYSQNTATIIELKDHVDLSALRQALNYAELWNGEISNLPLSAVLVVGRTGDPQIVEIGASMGVIVELLPRL